MSHWPTPDENGLVELNPFPAEGATLFRKEKKIRIKLYCKNCGYIDIGKDKLYTSYSINLDAFSRIKCNGCKKINWYLDIELEEV